MRGDNRDTCEAAETNGAGRSEVEIVLREKNAGAGFGDERLRVGKPTKSGVELKAVARRDPDTRDALVRELIEKVTEAQKRFPGGRDEVVDGAIDDGSGRAHGREDCSGSSHFGGKDRGPRTRKRNGGRRQPPTVSVKERKKLATRLAGSRRRGLAVHLGNAQVTADRVPAHLVDD